MGPPEEGRAYSAPLVHLLLLVLLISVVCGLPRGIQASVYDGYIGVRSEAMGGAHRGLGTSNDTIALNPAAMALSKRYSIDLGYARGGLDGLDRVHVSALDSRTSQVAGALSYSYVTGDGRGDYNASLHHFSSAVAYPLTAGLALGINYKTIRGSYKRSGKTQSVQLNTGDVGLAMRLGQTLSIGISYQNILPVREAQREFAKPAIGGGLGMQAGKLSMAIDGSFDMRTAYRNELSIFAGVEYILGTAFPLRAGWKRMPFTDRKGARRFEQVWSGGTGWVGKQGSLEVSYTRSLQRRNRNWNLLLGLKFFM